MQTSGPTGAAARAPRPEREPVAAAAPDPARHAADLRTYRRRRRTAVRATVLVAGFVGNFAVSAAMVLHEGGDTRFGIIPFFLAIASAAAGAPLLVRLWRSALDARRATLPPPPPEPEPEPRPHLGLSGQVPPPTRW